MQSNWMSSRLWNEDVHHKPIITPPISSSNSNSNNSGEQFLLVPSNRMIRVLSLKNGNLISKLNPYLEQQQQQQQQLDDDEKKPKLEIKKLQLLQIPKTKKTTTTTSSSSSSTTEDVVTDVSSDDDEDDEDKQVEDDDGEEDEWVILGLCQNGSICEWTLKSILLKRNDNAEIYARRQLTLSERSLVDMTTIPSSGCPSIIYGLSKEGNDDGITRLVRVSIPSYNNNNNGGDGIVSLDDDDCKYKSRFQDEKLIRRAAMMKIDDDNKGRSSQKAFPYSLFSCQNEDCIFVLILNPTGFTIYCESKSDDDDDAQLFETYDFPLVYKGHLTTTAAMAPNGQDVALGFDNGVIQVFRNVLGLTAAQFRSSSNKEEEESTTFSYQELLVTQTFHWHPLPVKVLQFSGRNTATTSGTTTTTAAGASSTFAAAPSCLLSGGEESVLVTWSLDRGLTRPIHTLPRVAKGSITSIVVNDEFSMDMEIVLACSDSTLQLLQAHNHTTQWKLQGLATHDNDDAVISTHHHHPHHHPPIMRMDPRTGLPMLTRLRGAPGTIQWFDPTSSRVVGELEVAPYNRVSRKERTDPQLPRPEITHLAMSDSGDDVITVDTILSENQHVGVSREIPHHNHNDNDGISTTMSLTTTIKFWRWMGYNHNHNNHGSGSGANRKYQSFKEMPYEMISAMPSPHGLFGSIDSLAMSPNGSRACSLSHEDGTFRIWGRGDVGADPTTTSSSSTRRVTTVWKCLYKVTIPSGYPILKGTSINTATGGGNLVSFSSDGSVLAVAHEKDITIWDHSNALLLNTIHSSSSSHGDGIITNMEFIPMSNDMILSSSGSSSFQVLPPSGQGYLGNGNWSYSQSDDTWKVQVIVPIPEFHEIAIAMTQDDTTTTTKSIVMILNVQSGEPKYIHNHKTKNKKKKKESQCCQWEIDGQVTNMCQIPTNGNNKVWSDKKKKSGYRLLVLTSQGDMMVLSGDSSSSNSNTSTSIYNNNTIMTNTNGSSNPFLGGSITTTNNNNILPILSVNNKNHPNKRRKRSISDEEEEDPNPFGINTTADASSSTHVPSSELPVLSGAFTRNFIGRNLKRGNASQ